MSWERRTETIKVYVWRGLENSSYGFLEVHWSWLEIKSPQAISFRFITSTNFSKKVNRMFLFFLLSVHKKFSSKPSKLIKINTWCQFVHGKEKVFVLCSFSCLAWNEHFSTFYLTAFHSSCKFPTSKSVSYFRPLHIKNEALCNDFKAMEIVEIGKLLDVCRGGWTGEQFDMESEAESKTTPHFL